MNRTEEIRQAIWN